MASSFLQDGAYFYAGNEPDEYTCMFTRRLPRLNLSSVTYLDARHPHNLKYSKRKEQDYVSESIYRLKFRGA